MSKITIMVGIPASGKTTVAKELADENTFISERDIIRYHMYDNGEKWSKKLEEKVTKIQTEGIISAMQNGMRDIIVSDTNLNEKTRNRLENIAGEFGYEVEYYPVHCDLDTALERNSKRTGYEYVPEDVIKKMYVQMVEQFPKQYEPNPELPPCYIFDIDGTIAEKNNRSPYEWHRVGEDNVHWDVVEIMRYIDNNSIEIILLSGRDAVCRPETRLWLADYSIPYDELYMRQKNDMMKDSAVKHDLFWKHVAPYYNVRGIFDDRDQVVKQWRRMGIRCYQVAEGNF